MRNVPAHLLPFLFTLLLSAMPAAHANRIVMKNGDVISGKITQVDEKEVTINPDYTKKFAVRRSAVISLETDGALEVELASGEVVRARFAGLDEGVQVMEVAEHPTPVSIESVTKASVPQRWYVRESRAEAGLTVNEGNTVNRSAVFNIDTRLRLGDHRQYARFMARRDENKGKTTKKQNLASYEYDWLFRRGWYLGATGQYERDPIRDLNHRFTFGVLLGHDFVDSAHRFLTIKAGAG
jgi:hypothetical protein